MDKKILAVTILISAVLLTVAFAPLSGQQGSNYDPWLDFDGDGKVDASSARALDKPKALALALYHYKGVFLETNFEALDGFTEGADIGNGINTVDGEKLLMTTGAVSGDSNYVDKMADSLYDASYLCAYSHRSGFKTCILLENVQNLTVWIGNGGHDDMSEGYGFKIINNEIFGYTQDGTEQALTPALATLAAITPYKIEASFVPNVGCKFYINSVLKGILTTKLPSSDASYFSWVYVYITTNAHAVKRISIGSWLCIVEP